MAADRPPRMRELSALLDMRADLERTAEFQGRTARVAALQQQQHAPAVKEAMAALDSAVAARSGALSAELARVRVLGGAVQRFTVDAVELLEWLRARSLFPSLPPLAFLSFGVPPASLVPRAKLKPSALVVASFTNRPRLSHA